jgi:hypothetical protein
MKNLLVLILTVLALNSCSNNDDNKPSTPKTELEKLPPATQNGANTAGCLVNGKAFLPKGFIPGDNPLGYQDGLNFALSIGERKNDIIKSVFVFSSNQTLEVGIIYQLGENNNNGNSKYGVYSIDAVPPPSPDYYTTNNIIVGELKITHHDFNNAILSGTFWFDAVNSNGEKVEVREGRFDRHY